MEQELFAVSNQYDTNNFVVFDLTRNSKDCEDIP